MVENHYSKAGKLGWLAAKHTHELRNLKFKEIYYNNPKKCLYCNNIIEYKKRENDFCSQKCYRTYITYKYHKDILPFKYNKNNKIVINCLNCGKEIERHSPKQKFCNNKCQGEYNFKQKVLLIEQNGEFPSRFQNECSRPFVKKYLISKYGHKCSICGNTEWMGQPIPLIVDHIDGDPLNNKINNFRLVCGNCDMLLPTYKNKNRGNGRKYRHIKNNIE